MRKALSKHESDTVRLRVLRDGELLEVVAELLKERYGVSDVSYHRKPSASKPAEPGVIEEMAADCDYVIVAIGS